MSNSEGFIMFIALAVGILLMCYGLVSYDVQRLSRPVKKALKKRDHKAEYWNRKRKGTITKYWLISFQDLVFANIGWPTSERSRVKKYRTRSEAVRKLMEDDDLTFLADIVDDPYEVKTMPFFLFKTVKAYKNFVKSMPYSRDDFTKHRWEEKEDSMLKANIRHLTRSLSWLSPTDYAKTERVVFGGKWLGTNLEQAWPDSDMEESYDLDQEAVRWRLHKVDRDEHVNSMKDMLKITGFEGLSIYAHLVNENYKENGETTIKVPFYGDNVNLTLS